DGLEAGNPYTLALWEKMSGPDITSDVGLFAVPAGLIPGSFNGVALLQTWPIFSGNGDWMQDMMPFTIPAQYAGMDFYFFIEYSIAPDIIPGTKTFDDIRFIDLTTGLAQHVDQHVDRGHQVVSDLLRVSGAPGPTPVEVLGLDGRSLARKAVHEGTVDVSELPCGTYMARRGNRIQRFTKE
ncbi:MAG: hypothetical protein JNL43_15475, partial [Flavobacteriales bacterium]|nr:hypothetical protein [Flavobacteriales bacterium]